MRLKSLKSLREMCNLNSDDKILRFIKLGKNDNFIQLYNKGFKEFMQNVETEESSCKNSDTYVKNIISHKKSGDTALHVAAMYGNVEILRFLLQKQRCFVDHENLDGKTPLHDAAQNAQLEAVKYLVSQGANINAVKKADWTPLMLACTKDSGVPTVSFLMENGADPYFANKDGWTAFHIGGRTGNTEILKVLLSQLKSIDGRKKLLTWKSKNGRRALHTAVMHGKLAATKFMFEEYKNIPEISQDWNESDNCGSTPVMDAVRFGFLHILELLLEFSESPKVVLNECNKSGQNCLHVAAESGQSEVIRFMVTNQYVNIDLPSETFGMTALHWATKEGQANSVRTLIELGASVNTKDSYGRTCKDLSVQFCKEDITLIYNNWDITKE